MADYEELVLQVRDDGRTVTVTNPTVRAIDAMVIEQRRPFGTVWHGEHELIHVVGGAFVTAPPLPPGAALTLTFRDEEADAPIVRQPSNKGLTILDARRDPRTGETVLRVRVCRAQPLAVEGVDPAGVYQVQVDDEAAYPVLPRLTRTIQALLSKQTDGRGPQGHRAIVPGTLRFLDLLIHGDDARFVERTIRIRRLEGAEAQAARAALLAAVPPRTGRVT
jgi:hypothetical protein